MAKRRDDNREAICSQSELRAHLERILASKSFARSESLSSFLRFVVEETLAGRGGRLQGRTIATQALGRSKKFNAKADPIVSIQASRLRRALDAYYDHEGRDEIIRVRLPKGGYQPRFERMDVSVTPTEGGPTAPSPRGPRVAVIPLIDLDQRDANEYFGVGLTQELVAAIASFRELTVLDVPPLNNGDSVADLARRLARQAGVRFVLSGTFRKDDNSIVLRVQLRDASTAEVIWTEKIRLDQSASQLLDLEEDIADRVGKTVAENYGVISRRMTIEAHKRPVEELSVYDAVLRFRHYQFVVTNEARDRAIDALERAIQLDPDYALCWAMLSEAICDAYGLRINCRLEVVTRARELARRAISLDPECQHAHWALAYSHFHARERDEFLQASESTIKLNPNNGYLVGISAWAMALVGEWERGLSILDRLMEQNPYYPTWMHLAPYLHHYQNGEFQAALDHANAFNIPDLAWDSILRAAALARTGRHEEAKDSLNKFTSGFPDAATDPAHYLRGYIFLDELVDEVVDGLRMAGWTKSKSAISSNAG